MVGKRFEAHDVARNMRRHFAGSIGVTSCWLARLALSRISKQAIPWVMVPRDAGRNGIEVQMLRFVAKLHEFVSQNKDIFAVPVYSLEFQGNKVVTVFGIFQTGQNTFKINDETFQGFIKSLMSRPEMYV